MSQHSMTTRSKKLQEKMEDIEYDNFKGDEDSEYDSLEELEEIDENGNLKDFIDYSEDKNEKKALENLIIQLKKTPQNTPAEEIQTIIYSTGKENGYKENLRDWFKLIYQVTFGEENGPRMGFFISFFGVKDTIDLMEKKLKI